MNQKEYESDFGVDPEKADMAKAERALEHALEMRKFEIGLYWRRAAYFWALIAGAFAGYFVILNETMLGDRFLLASILGCIGLFFTWALFLVNRGSKYWQENWESHVEMLEDAVMGPLYKTAFHRPPASDVCEKYVTGPLPMSVSKVHQWVSAFTLCAWVILICHAWIDWKCGAVDVMTVAFGLLTFYKARTSMGESKHVAEKRKTTINS